VFLKEFWKASSSRVHEELKIYQKLAEADVDYVPAALGGGIVAEPSSADAQQTKTQEFFKQVSGTSVHEHVCRPFRHEHYRLVLKEIGVPLEEYIDGQHLVMLLAQALQGKPLLVQF
jgi:hypothetical protein